MLTILAIIVCYLLGAAIFVAYKLPANDPAGNLVVVQILICIIALITIVICSLSGYTIQAVR